MREFGENLGKILGGFGKDFGVDFGMDFRVNFGENLGWISGRISGRISGWIWDFFFEDQGIPTLPFPKFPSSHFFSFIFFPTKITKNHPGGQSTDHYQAGGARGGIFGGIWVFLGVSGRERLLHEALAVLGGRGPGPGRARLRPAAAAAEAEPGQDSGPQGQETPQESPFGGEESSEFGSEIIRVGPAAAQALPLVPVVVGAAAAAAVGELAAGSLGRDVIPARKRRPARPRHRRPRAAPCEGGIAADGAGRSVPRCPRCPGCVPAAVPALPLAAEVVAVAAAAAEHETLAGPGGGVEKPARDGGAAAAGERR